MATNPMEVMSTEPPMTDEELVAYLAGHETNALGYYEDEVSEQQAQAIDYYYRRMPDLPAAEGCSSVVDGTVAIVVDNALAAILKPFVSADETVSFMPRGPEDMEMAEQATEYVNFIFQVDNPGFLILHNWFKDALLTKLGIVRVDWEENQRVIRETVLATDELQLAMYRMDEGYAGEVETPEGVAVTLAKVINDGRVKIENIPPEEFMINPFARSLEDATYVAHVPSNISRSDLVEMGFDADVVEKLPASTPQYYSEAGESGRRDARYQDERFGGVGDTIGTPHASQEIVALRDEYIRIDFDGDGIAELRRVIRVENTILYNEEVSDHPFAVLCPVPMPHKVYGLSLADQTLDLQRISTALWRQTLDNLYKSNNPRPVIGEGAERADGSTGDSLMDNAPGAAILVRDGGQFGFASVPFTADKSFPMLAYIEEQQEARTGIGRAGQGLDKNALTKTGQVTATEMAMIQSGKNARAEMIARIFAETGVKRLFKMVLRLVVENQQQERVIRLRNKWVPIDVSNWDAEMDIEISVGLGVGDRATQIAEADAILETMALVAQSPFASMVTPENAYNAVKKKITAAGVKNVDDFVSDPAEMQPEERPDPEMAKVEAEAQLKAAEIEQKREQSMIEMQLQREKSALEIELAREKAAAEMELARQKAEFEAQMAAYKMDREQELARRKVEIDGEVKLSKNRPGGDLDK